MNMAASTSVSNSPHIGGFRTIGGSPYGMPRHKRSNSGGYVDAGMPRSYAEQHVMRPAAVDEMDTYVPASLGEELLERTYLEDVVRPLVRALVHARMGQAERERDTGAVAGAGVVSDGGARGSAYADLEKLRIELEQASQRARHAEAERDDLVRRLERADSDSARMGRPLPLPDRRPLSDQGHRGQEAPHGTGSAAASFAGPGVAVAVSHSENGPAAAVSVTTDTHHSVAAVARTTPSRVSPQTGFMAPRPRAFAESVRPAPSPAPWTGSGPSRSYEEERERERYSSAPRPMMGRMESAPSLSYHPPGGGYVVTPPYSFAHTDPEQQQQAQAQQHDYDSDRPRKQARMRNSFGSHDAQYLAPTRGYAPLPHAHGHGHGHAHAQAAPSEASFPAPRKLASTKNRTCSNCAAPHDAKFRRGPNGPGTLCDRCGSRWKKYKESEAAAMQGSNSGNGDANGRGRAGSGSAQSPIESQSQDGQGRRSPSKSVGGGGAGSYSASPPGPELKREETERERDRDRERERDSWRRSHERDGGSMSADELAD